MHAVCIDPQANGRKVQRVHPADPVHALADGNPAGKGEKAGALFLFVSTTSGRGHGKAQTMTPAEVFRKFHSNPKWAQAMESDAMSAAASAVLAQLAAMEGAEAAELRGARQALAMLPLLHHPDAPPPPNLLVSGLRHDLESVQRGKANHASNKRKE